MKKVHVKEESNNPIYFYVILVFLGIGFFTFIHDPILHGLFALSQGWEISGYETGLMVGSTSVLAPQTASTTSLWLFYMFPSLMIFLITIVITVLRPEKIVMIGGVLLMGLNLASFNPEITGSDANMAVNMLIAHGWSEFSGYVFHYAFLVIVLILWGLYLYIVIENNSNDAKRRIENIRQ